jgi:predicted ester cyclase
MPEAQRTISIEHRGLTATGHRATPQPRPRRRPAILCRPVAELIAARLGHRGLSREGERAMADAEADVRRFFDEVWNQGNAAAAEDFLAAEFTSHNAFDVTILGPDQYGRAVLEYRAAFPDLTVTLEDVFASGDRVAVRGIDRGTHQGEFMGRAASGRPVTATWIEIFRLRSGKAVEGWVETDTRRMLDQIS